MPAVIPLAAAAVGAAGSVAAANKTAKAAASSSQTTQMDPRMQELIYGSGASTLKPGVGAQWGVGTREDFTRDLNNQHLAKYGIGIPTDQASQDWLTNEVNARIAKGDLVQTNQAEDFANDTGLMGRITGLLDAPQSDGMKAFGGGMDSYLKDWGTGNFLSAQQAAQGLMGSNIQAPTMGSAIVANTPGMQAASVANTPGMQAASMQAAQVNAPSQNNTNLQPAYTDMIYGERGNNPYLTGAIQKGINQSTNAFGNYLTDATKSTQDLLGGIRGGAVLNNTMGSSRQGIAEGKAIDSFNTNVSRAMTQFGQNNTDAAVAAQAGAYDADSNRALSAMSGLSQNQYGTAFQNAGFEQQANQTNAGFQQQAAQNNYQGSLQSNLANAGYQNNANQTNYGGLLQSNLANAGYQQQALGNNLQSQLQTQNLNSDRQQAGIGLSSGLLNQAYGYGSAQDSYQGNKVGQVAGLLGQFAGQGGTTTGSQPMYSNTAGNMIGGGLLGLQLARAAGGMGQSSSQSSSGYNGLGTMGPIGGSLSDPWYG